MNRHNPDGQSQDKDRHDKKRHDPKQSHENFDSKKQKKDNENTDPLSK